MPPALLVVLVAVALIVLAVPLRRLHLDGRSNGTVISYAVLLLALGVAVTEARPLARYLLPIIGLVYIAPFITWRGGIDRLLRREQPDIEVTRREPPSLTPPRNVTPPDAPDPDEARSGNGSSRKD